MTDNLSKRNKPYVRELTPEALASWKKHSKARAERQLADNPDHFKQIGRKGGLAKVPKGFAMTGLASRAGTLGGSVSGNGKHQKAKLSGIYESQGIKLTREKS